MKRLLAIVLAVVMVASMSVITSFAATPGQDVETPGGSASADVKLYYGYDNYDEDPDTNSDLIPDGPGSGNNFSVTVPTVIPFGVDADGNVTVSNNVKITNNSKGMVEVTNVAISTANNWEIVNYGTDFTKVPVDSKQFTFQLNGDNVAATAIGETTNLTLGRGWVPLAGVPSDANDTSNILPLPYSGDFAVQSEAINGLKIAEVVFTVDWYTGD